MSTFIGNLGVFDYKTQEWKIFYGRLMQFVKLNSIKDERKASLLLTHLSDESYRLASNLVHPQELEDVAWTELVELLNGHFQPKRSTFADRSKFYDATKADNESLEDWAARLRGFAVYCDFGTALDTLLRDKFVLGLKAGPEKDRLFEKDSSTLTFSKALEVAQQAACARAARAGAGKDVAEVNVKEEPVYRVGERRAQAQPARPAAGSAAAGKSGLNHVAVDYSDGHNCKECDLFNLRYVNSCDPITVDVIIDNGVDSAILVSLI